MTASKIFAGLGRLMLFFARAVLAAAAVAAGVLVLDYAFELMEMDFYPCEALGLMALATGAAFILVGIWWLVSSFHPENLVIRE